MKVNFIDLSVQYQSLKKEIDKAIEDVIDNSAFIKSPQVNTFEKDFAQYLGVDHVVSCGNGTDALEIVLKAFEIGEGDEVIVPAMSWISTSEVVVTAGAKPVFVDIDEHSYCIDPNKIEEKITSRTKAIIPVHLYGHPAAMKEIRQIAGKYDLKVIEDCAQAHGAKIDGKKIGTFGDAATFSFFPTKNLGAFGDAGAMVLRTKETRDKAAAIANHGQVERHRHTLHGRNSRMDGLQAAVLSVKLKYLDQWIEARQKVAEEYKKQLESVGDIILPSVSKDASHVYHLFVIQTAKRDELKEYLLKKEISTMIHYPVALPFQPCYKEYDLQPGDFPVAFKLQNEGLSLPMYPELDSGSIAYTSNQIKNFKF